MRGRLINRFLIEIRQLDVFGAASDDAYDPILKEPKLLATGDGVGSPDRREKAAILVPGQFEVKSEWRRLQMTNNGNLSESLSTVIFHFRDLERLGLVEASTGLAAIRVGDRMSAIYDLRGRLVQIIPDPPGLFVQQADPRYGLGNSRNLLVVTFVSRDQGMPVAQSYS